MRSPGKSLFPNKASNRLKGETMHFRAKMWVSLNQPLSVKNSFDDEKPVGYVIVIGVNAPDLVTAVRFAHDVALRSKQTDGSFQSFDGVVVRAEVQRIEKNVWEPNIREKAKRIDHEGVYYSSDLMFFV
jgi:hypothetical protein